LHATRISPLFEICCQSGPPTVPVGGVPSGGLPQGTMTAIRVQFMLYPFCHSCNPQHRSVRRVIVATLIAPCWRVSTRRTAGSYGPGPRASCLKLVSAGRKTIEGHLRWAPKCPHKQTISVATNRPRRAAECTIRCVGIDNRADACGAGDRIPGARLRGADRNSAADHRAL
jgi:hypothetical protein